MSEQRSGIGRALAGVFYLAWLVWGILCLRSYAAGSGGTFEELFFAARDQLQPSGYSINGALRADPSWGVFHLALTALPGLFPAATRLARALRRRTARS